VRAQILPSVKKVEQGKTTADGKTLTNAYIDLRCSTEKVVQIDPDDFTFITVDTGNPTVSWLLADFLLV
jgi:hypothetical protein